MADKKFSELDAIDAIASDDIFAVVDTSTGETRRAAISQLNIPAPGGLEGWVSVKDKGAVGNGVADDRAAFIQAITDAGDGVVWIPPGTYRIGSDINIRRRVNIIGAGGVGISDISADPSTSIIALDPGVSIIVDSATSSSNNGSAVGSMFSSFAVKQHANEAAGTHMIEIYARSTWTSVSLYGDPGGGHGFAVLSGNHENTRNMWVDCRVNATGGDAWHLLVGNSTIIGGEAISCVGKGVYIANVFGCLVAGTRLIDCNPSGTAFQLTGAPGGQEHAQGQHIAVGCGVSGGNGKIFLGAAAMWIGGPSTAGLTTDSQGLYLPSGDFWTPLRTKNTATSIAIDAFLGVKGTSQIGLQFQSSDDPSETRYHYDETNTAQRWLWRHTSQGGFGAWEMSASGHIEGAGQLLLPRGFFLGVGGGRRYQTYAGAQPTGAGPRPSNNWFAGDIVWNNRTIPANDAVVFWRCTVDGNPGTWVPYP